jgi:hypothetical protein
MKQLVSALRQAASDSNWRAALFIGLAMPDICGKLQSPLENSGKRYRAWFEKYLAANYVFDGPEGPQMFMTAGDCWALRCALLHAGSDEINEQQAQKQLSQFKFTTNPAAHMMKIESVLVLNVGRFCEEICTAAELWMNDMEGNLEVEERIKSMMVVEESVFSPIPGVLVS